MEYVIKNWILSKVVFHFVKNEENVKIDLLFQVFVVGGVDM